MLYAIVSLFSCFGADVTPAMFTVTVPRNLASVQVEARYSVTEPYLMIDEGSYSEGVEGGLAGFVENLRVTRADGSSVSVEAPESGRWRIGTTGGEAVTVRYDVRLDHGDHRWPFGGDEVGYVRGNAAFFVSRTILLVSRGIGESRIRFVLPDTWRVAAAWPLAGDDPATFVAQGIDRLLDSCVIVGDFLERDVGAGETRVTLAMGRDLEPYGDALEDAIRDSVVSYTELFQASPPVRFLAVVNTGGLTNGSAFRNSVSLITPKRMEGANFVQAVYTISHEILHLWNGYLLRPVGQSQWFMEGFTDYLTWRTLAALKLVPEKSLLVELRRQAVAYLNDARTVTIGAAGDDRAMNKNKVLVYEGGSLAALCLDVRVQEASGGARGFRDFMRAVYAQSALQNKPYDNALIAAVASETAGTDLRPFFDRYVYGNQPLPLEECFAKLGLRLATERKGPDGRVSVTIEVDEAAAGAIEKARNEFLGRS